MSGPPGGGRASRRAGKTSSAVSNLSGRTPPGDTTRTSPGGGALTSPGGTPESREVRRLISLGRPIYCGGSHGREIALTFDDGPGSYTSKVISKLRRHHEGATFFIVGRNIKLIPGVTRAERGLGAVGDHTFTHPLLTAIPRSRARQEIVRTRRLLERSSGGPVFLFRPPYGGRDKGIDAIVRANGLLEVLWSVDSADSLGANYAQIRHNVIAGLHPGAIILMHENRGQTVRALLPIFEAIRRKGLHAVSLPQLLTDDPPSPAQVRSGRCDGQSSASSHSGG
jgi:peptidoglycan/xylan/chitin deacetylase (PgdA/CDA1 family)